MTNIAAIAASVVLDLTARFINSDAYPTHDPSSGIGQMTCVQMVNTNGHAGRASGFVVSRIITDRSGGPNHGEKWVLVEFGDGPPWQTCPLTNLVPVACSVALRDFPTNGLATMERMLPRE